MPTRKDLRWQVLQILAFFAAGNGCGLGLGLVPIYGVDIPQDDLVCFHGYGFMILMGFQG